MYFISNNIARLSLKVIQTKENYQAIVKLNNTYDRHNIFMIHPGAAGCEVYTSLAQKLENSFSCYGVDSYNLYNDKKINDLHSLAKIIYYLLIALWLKLVSMYTIYLVGHLEGK